MLQRKHNRLLYPFRWLVLFLGCVPLWAEVDYEAQLKPLMRERCLSCHGALQQKAGLRLDTVDAMRRGGKSGPALVPGNPAESRMLQRISSSSLDDRMPPEHEGQPFSPAQIALLREWISHGAPGPVQERPELDPKEHWAFRPRIRPTVPSFARDGWVRNPIDSFLQRGHQQHGLRPRPEAPRSILVRRLYFDLLGLPPTPIELDRVLRDASPDWYERTVDRLLDDPRHGERWARHWMDIWRYSDAWGLGDQLRNSQKHIWHWRDWIVESLNHDLPYDIMVHRMLAADESHPNDLDQLRATGYLARNYFLFNRNQWLDETVEHVAKGFLGLTLNCAKCHDHKYDPFSQRDYYRMRAVFEPYHVRLEMLPGETDLQRNAVPRAYDCIPEVPTYRFIRGQETQPDRSVTIPPGIPDLLAFSPLQIHPVSLPLEAWQPERRSWVIQSYRDSIRSRLESARRRRESYSNNLSSADTRTVTERQWELSDIEWEIRSVEAEATSLEKRIELLRIRWEGGKVSAELHRDAVLAERHATLARFKRIQAQTEWRLFQAGADAKEPLLKELKSTQEKWAQALRDLDAPVSPEAAVLPIVGAARSPTRFLDSTKDDPAVEFVAISSGRRTALADWITDPRNPLTARVAVNHVWNRHFGAPLVPTVFDFGRKGVPPADPELLDWLASDWIEHGWSFKHLHRRIVTSSAYRMGSSLAGAENELALDPDNRWWWRRNPIRLEAQAVRDALWHHAGQLDITQGGSSIPDAEQSASRRRSLYFYHSNNERNLFLTTFDDALVKECYRRDQSIVPQQALALLNSAQVHQSVPRIAEKLSAGIPPGNDTEFVREAFRVLLGFDPNPSELAASLQALSSRDMSVGSGTPLEKTLRARSHLVWVLVNHGDFVTLR